MLVKVPKRLLKRQNIRIKYRNGVNLYNKHNNSNYAKGILVATGENIIDNSNMQLTSIKNIYLLA